MNHDSIGSFVMYLAQGYQVIRLIMISQAYQCHGDQLCSTVSPD